MPRRLMTLPGLRFVCEVCGPQPARDFYPGKYRRCKKHWNEYRREYRARQRQLRSIEP
ncbi:MAG: hypothetical protein AB9873_17780 [Syntrophobacteraceae bacterium]